MKRTHLTVLAAASVLALTACGGNSTAGSRATPAGTSSAPTSSASSTPLSQAEWMASGQPKETGRGIPEPTGSFSTPAGWGDTDANGNMLFHAGTYSLSTADGGKVRFQLPTPTTHQLVAPLESYRTATGGAPVTYLVADVDNRKGAQNIGMASVAVFDPDGKKIEFTPAWKAVGDWQSKLPSDAPAGVYNRGVDLYNANLRAIEPAERRSIVLTAPVKALPASFARVTAMPSGYDSEQIALPEWMNSQLEASMPSYNCPRAQGPTCGVEVPRSPNPRP